MRFLILLISTISLFACKNQTENHTNTLDCQIDSIHVYYYNYLFNSIISRTCEDVIEKRYPIEDGDVIDTLITNIEILRQIEAALLQLEADIPYSQDTRFVAVVYWKSKEISQVCIGGYFSTFIVWNGIRQNENNELLYLLKLHSGYYSWLDDDEISAMPELKDTTFLREIDIIAERKRHQSFY